MVIVPSVYTCLLWSNLVSSPLLLSVIAEMYIRAETGSRKNTIQPILGGQNLYNTNVVTIIAMADSSRAIVRCRSLLFTLLITDCVKSDL